ncbi:MAG: hypothetical protein J6Y94_01285, partial [Bacteriovoracaceae bacterium]|nr:hypothetical protein [Bacteriovoracaceae bacterium]
GHITGTSERCRAGSTFSKSLTGGGSITSCGSSKPGSCNDQIAGIICNGTTLSASYPSKALCHSGHMEVTDLTCRSSDYNPPGSGGGGGYVNPEPDLNATQNAQQTKTAQAQATETANASQGGCDDNVEGQYCDGHPLGSNLCSPSSVWKGQCSAISSYASKCFSKALHISSWEFEIGSSKYYVYPYMACGSGADASYPASWQGKLPNGSICSRWNDGLDFCTAACATSGSPTTVDGYQFCPWATPSACQNYYPGLYCGGQNPSSDCESNSVKCCWGREINDYRCVGSW